MSRLEQIKQFKLIEREKVGKIINEKSKSLDESKGHSYNHQQLLALIKELTDIREEKKFDILKDDQIWRYIGLTNDIGGILSHSGKIFYKQDRDNVLNTKSIPYIRLRGAEQTEFLIAHLYFLLVIYIKRLREPSDPTSNDDNYNVIKDILLDEILITINAAYIYYFYYYSLLLSEELNKEALIRNFVIRFLESFQENFDSINPNSELCVPCGFKGHAMYLALVRLQNTKKVVNDEVEVLFRIDNLGNGIEYNPKLKLTNSKDRVNSFLLTKIAIKDLLKNSNIIDRLVAIFMASREEREPALDKIYADCSGLPSLGEITKKYPLIEFSKQKTENCVFKSFFAGFCYRVAAEKIDDQFTFDEWLITKLTLTASEEIRAQIYIKEEPEQTCKDFGAQIRREKLLKVKKDFLDSKPKVLGELTPLMLESRPALQDQLTTYFNSSGGNRFSPPKIAICWGLDGNFKSLVALQYVLSSKKYGLRAWFVGGQLESGYIDFCYKLSNIHAGNLEDAKSTIKKKLFAIVDWLLIFEDVDDLEKIQSYLPQQGKGDILITFRKKPEPRSFSFYPIEVKPFGLNEAKKLLKKYLTHVDDYHLEHLARELDYQPLPLLQAIVFLKKHPHTITNKEMKQYAQDLVQSRITVKDLLQGSEFFDLKSDGVASVGATWHLTMRHIEKESPLALWILECCAYLFHKDIPKLVLKKLIRNSPYSSEYSSDQKEKDSEALCYRNVILLLEDFSLISVQQESISLRRLYKEYICWRDKKQLRLAGIYNYRLKHLAKILYEIYPFDKRIEGGRDDYSLALSLKPHLNELAIHLEQGISNQDSGEVSSKEHLVNILMALGDLHAIVLSDYTEAHKYNQRALELRLKSHDKNLFRLARIYNSLGISSRGRGDEKEALSHHHHSLKSQVMLTGEKKSIVIEANSYNGIGISQYLLGEYKAAKESHLKALSLRKISHGEKSLSVTASYDNLGEVCVALGEIHQAACYYLQAIAIRKEIIRHNMDSTNHRILCIPYMGIGEVLLIQGHAKKALKYFQDAEEILLNTYSDEGARELVLCRNFMGRAYLALNDKEQARETHQQVINIFKKKGITNHRDLANSYFCLGDDLLALNEIKQANKKFRAAYSIYKDRFGVRHPFTLNCIEKIAMTEFKLGHKESAYKKLTYVVKVRFLIYHSENHPGIALSYENLSKIYQDNDIAQEKEYITKALEIYQQFKYQSKVKELTIYLASLEKKASSFSSSVGKYPRIFLNEPVNWEEIPIDDDVRLSSRL